MRFKQTLSSYILLITLLIFGWDTAGFAQSDEGSVRRGRRIEAQPVTVEEAGYGDTIHVEKIEESEVESVSDNEISGGTPANDEYLEGDARKRDFSSESWREASEGLDYSKDRPEPVKEDEPDLNLDPSVGSGIGESLGMGMQVLLFGGIIVILALLLFLLVGGKYTKNTKIRNEGVFTIEDIEERIHESDLEKFLREALAKNDFRMAVRIYYLAIIKELSLRELIRWKKDKTNREYLNEVVSRKPEIYNDFRDTTLAFEKVWYGDITITEGDYMSISPRFKKFIENLGRLN